MTTANTTRVIDPRSIAHRDRRIAGAMRYDPFARGSSPVGVRTLRLESAALDTGGTEVEVWYPASDAHRGQDFDDSQRDRISIAPGFPEWLQHAVRSAAPEPGTYPVFMYFHGGYGHRQEATHVCTHLASHGYLVAAPDFPGDNIRDTMPSADGSAAAMVKTPIDESARRRPVQASLFIELLLGLTLPGGQQIHVDRIGCGGISMGGYTSLAVNAVSARFAAAFPMCPMFGEHSMVPQVRRLQSLLRVDNWLHPVPTLLLTGEVDPLVKAEDIRQLYSRLAPPKRLVVLRKAGHMHFADNAAIGHEWYRKGYLSGEFPDPEIDSVALGTAMRPFSELCNEAQGGGTARGLCLAHMDAQLKRRQDAAAFLDGDLSGALGGSLGVEIDVLAPPSAPRATT